MVNFHAPGSGSAFPIWIRIQDIQIDADPSASGSMTLIGIEKYYVFLRGIFLDFSFFMYDIQHCFICLPSDSTVSEDAGIEPRTVATPALAVRRSNHSPRYIHNSARSHPLTCLHSCPSLLTIHSMATRPLLALFDTVFTRQQKSGINIL